VVVLSTHREVAGVARDVEPDGALVVERTDGATERFLSGEVSVRG
jgi:biotin-(acetyl-CoA carboxylase) ligase